MAKIRRGDKPGDEYYKQQGFERLSLRVRRDVRQALDARVDKLGRKKRGVDGWTVTDLVTALVRHCEESGWPKLERPSEDQEK